MRSHKSFGFNIDKNITVNTKNRPEHKVIGRCNENIALPFRKLTLRRIRQSPIPMSTWMLFATAKEYQPMRTATTFCPTPGII